jgi:hypothetical protein
MKSMHIRNGDLWPSTLYVGSTVIKFLVGPKGRSIKVESHGDNPPVPRHKPLPKAPRKRYNRSR